MSLILAGTYWDISWHMTVGRDTFWTPAHVAIQLGGLFAGIAGIVLILGTTLRIVAGSYTAFMVLMLWLFPLFPAEAKLGPVYQPITHFIPLEFPPLIVVPAIAIDVVRARLRQASRLRLAAALGVVFLVTLVAVEWPFATFLQSPASHGRLFATQDLPYFMHPDWHEAKGTFLPDPARWSGMAEALIAAIASAALGLVVGDAMRRLRR